MNDAELNAERWRYIDESDARARAAGREVGPRRAGCDGGMWCRCQVVTPCQRSPR